MIVSLKKPHSGAVHHLDEHDLRIKETAQVDSSDFLFTLIVYIVIKY